MPLWDLTLLSDIPLFVSAQNGNKFLFVNYFGSKFYVSFMFSYFGLLVLKTSHMGDDNSTITILI